MSEIGEAHSRNHHSGQVVHSSGQICLSRIAGTDRPVYIHYLALYRKHRSDAKVDGGAFVADVDESQEIVN